MSPRARGGARARGLRRDLEAIAAFDAVFGPPAPVDERRVAEDLRDTSHGLGTTTEFGAYGTRTYPTPPPAPEPPASIEIQAHLLGPEHCGRFVEVPAPAERPDRGSVRDAGPFAGRLVGYRVAVHAIGPGTGTPVRSLELFIQQGPHTSPVVVTWADTVRIAA